MKDMHFDPISLRRQIVAGAIEEVELSLADAVAHHGENAIVEELLGALAYRRGETQAALDHAERALAFDRAFVPGHILRIRALSRLGKHEMAAASSDALLVINSDDKEVLLATARAYEKFKAYDAAADSWLKLAERRPDDASVRAQVIDMLELAGRYREAIDYSLGLCDSGAAPTDVRERCLLLALRWGEPKDVTSALQALADADLDKALESVSDLTVAGRFADAEWVVRRGAEVGQAIHPALAASLSRSVIAQAKDAEARGNMLIALAAWGLVRALGVDDRAAPRLEKAGVAVSKSATALLAQGKVEEAEAQIDALVRIWPTARAWSASAAIAKARERWNALGQAYGEIAILSAGDEREEAILRAIRAVRKSKDFTASLKTLTRMAQTIGPHAGLDEAAGWAFDKLRRQTRDDLKAGDLITAGAAYCALLAWDPDSDELPALGAKIVKGHSLAMSDARRAGDLPAAAAAAQRLLALVPDRLDALKFSADHHLKIGLHASAARLYERLLALLPDDHRYLYKLARAYRSTGDHARGAEVTRRFLAIEPDHKGARELLNAFVARSTG